MREKQKILFVITKGNWGGAQKYVYEVATKLPITQFDVCVAHGVGEILPQKLQQSGIKTLFIPQLGRDVNIFKDLSSFFTLITLFKKERPQIVHLNSSKIGGLGALAARIAGIPKIVFTVHGFAFNEDRTFIQKWIIGFLSWITIILCTDVICISKTEFKRASHWIGTSSKLHLIYNGIPVPSYLDREQAQKILMQHTGISETLLKDKTLIVTLGELTKNKGYTYALEALKNIPNTIYVIIGDGEQKEALQKTISDTHLNEKIFLAGFIKDASQLLKAFDVFLLPSLKEGMPYVLLEAGLAELPVITTPVGGIPEIIQDNVSGFFIEPRSSNSIQTIIKKVIDSPQISHSAAQNLQLSIKNTFSVDNMIIQTQKVYEL